MLFNEEKILSNYILSLIETIRQKQIQLKFNGPSRELFTEINTLQVVKDDLRQILDNKINYKTYWVVFNNKK